jgi:flagellar biosynthesis/type III secretory pathway protein FliH
MAARVIKGVGSPIRAPLSGADGGKRVIEKEVFRAQQEAAEIVAKAEKEKERILAEGRQRAARAREEAQSEGAAEAFAKAAEEALLAFRHRAERYGEAANDVRVLAVEVVRKVLGSSPKLTDAQIDEFIARGLARLRARRKLRVQVSEERRSALERERPLLMARLRDEPDLVIEATDDVSKGFARVVTEIGGALCQEQAALDQLAAAVGVVEKAVAPRPKSALQNIPDVARSNAPRARENFDDDEEDATDFLNAERHALLRKSRAPAVPTRAPAPTASSMVSVQTQRGTAKRIDPPAPGDGESTMALDVASLRDELRQSEDDRSDELELFADENVAPKKR